MEEIEITIHCPKCGLEVGYEDDCPNGCDGEDDV